MRKALPTDLDSRQLPIRLNITDLLAVECVNFRHGGAKSGSIWP
jgi:hypothetical protein